MHKPPVRAGSLLDNMHGLLNNCKFSLLINNDLLSFQHPTLATLIPHDKNEVMLLEATLFICKYPFLSS